METSRRFNDKAKTTTSRLVKFKLSTCVKLNLTFFCKSLEHPKNGKIEEKEDILTPDMHPHNFEADMYLEKLDQDHEKV